MSEDDRVTEPAEDPQRVWRPGRTIYAIDDPPPFFAEPGELPREWLPEPPVPLRDRLLPGLATVAAVVAGLVLLGAPVAFLWAAVAPTAVVLRTDTGPSPAAPESNQMFAVDGWFVVVTVVVGLVLGAVAWTLLRRRGPAVPVGLAAGGLLAAFVASEVGKLIVVDDYLYRFCRSPDVTCIVYDGTLHLHATAALAVWPVAMLASFAALLFVEDRRAQGSDRGAVPPRPFDEPGRPA